MSDVIEQLHAWFERYEPQVHALPPGLGTSELARLEAQLDVALPSALRALYAWHDGTGSLPLIANWMLMSASELVSTRALLRGFVEDGTFEHPHHWHVAWVPFLSNGAGSHVCLDPSGSFDGTPHQILEFWKADTDRTIVAASPEVWLERCVAALRLSTHASPAERNSAEELDAFEEVLGRPPNAPRRVDYAGFRRWPG